MEVQQSINETSYENTRIEGISKHFSFRRLAGLPEAGSYCRGCGGGSSIFQNHRILQCGAPKIAKLMQITPSNYSYNML